MTVPSNLVPFRITDLPTDPTPSASGILAYVRGGVTYQVAAEDIVAVSGVPTSRQVIAGTSLTGGGQLTSNVTLSVANAGIGDTQLSATGVTAGMYGTNIEIPQITVNPQGRVTAITTQTVDVTGNYVPTSRQVIAGVGLSGGGTLTTDVTLNAVFSNATPLSVEDTGSAGVSNTMSRADHKHPAIDLADDTQVNGLLGLDNGGTNRSLVPMEGAVIWSGADALYMGTQGQAGQVLVSGGTGAPTWGNVIVQSDQPANYIYAGPSSGPAGPTAFRPMVNADLPNSGVTAATYGSGSSVPVFAVNSKGVVTTVTDTPISIANTQVTGLGTMSTQNANNVNITGGSITGLSSAISVGSGGTGQTSYTDGQLLIGNSVGNTLTKSTLTAGSGISITNGNGSITISAPETGTVTSVDVSGGLTGLTTSGGPVTSSGTITLAGTLNPGYGGTGQFTYSDGELLIGKTAGNTIVKSTLTAGTGITIVNGSGTITISAPDNGTVSSVDVSGGTTGLTFSGGPITTSGTITMAGTLDVDNGGTGQTSYTNGQLLIGNTTGNTLTKSTLTAGTGVSITNGAGSITIASTVNAPYVQTFNATTDWGSASGGLYTITVPATTHGFGLNVSQVVTYQTSGSDSEQVTANSVLINNITGDVSITVTQTPDARFAGKLVIIQGQAITGSSPGVLTINALTASAQVLATGTSGTDFAINSASNTHTFNLPTASASNRGALSSADWSTFNSKANTVDIQFFTTSGTWTKPANAKNVKVYAFGAGGGGGSGRRAGAGVGRTGGGSGAGGAVVCAEFEASILGSSESITIGAGGAGGAPQTVDTTNGNAGTAGGTTTFGALLQAFGGGGGQGGSTLASSGGTRTYSASSPENFIQLAGIASAAGGVAGVNGNNTDTLSPPSGGSGAGLSVGNAASAGGDGGSRAATSIRPSLIVAGGTGGAAANNGSNGNTSSVTFYGLTLGSAGGGGGSSSVTPGAGGNGTGAGSGGGGGGATLNGVNSGAGGSGANGGVVVITYF
jgi:hypothetical protein